eukprot:TRINITY_DN1917_c0_g2_i2.p1 TRINITY_DN1917_c0_g2~~TRINITY_DN1917_c0_g2_i2.p1  ORF type:complete len:284 (+),score=66.96 TRINITY_DN1917_c0_g2_i2:130-981(+)
MENKSVEEFIKVLDNHIKECQKTGKYMEALSTTNRRDQLIKNIQIRKREFILQRHTIERSELENAQLDQFTQFSKKWEERMFESSKKAESQRDKLSTRHQQELDGIVFQLESQPLKSRPSKSLLELRALEALLAKNERYIDAHNVKTKADIHEMIELSHESNKQRAAFQVLESNLLTQQENERNALDQQIKKEKEALKKLMMEDLQRFLKKFNHLLLELETQHSIELSKLSASGYQNSVPSPRKKLAPLQLDSPKLQSPPSPPTSTFRRKVTTSPSIHTKKWR